MPRRKIYELKISLSLSEPEIWRTVQLPASTMLDVFHEVLQGTMGWRNQSKDHYFRNVDRTICYSDYENDLDETKYRISNLLNKVNDTMIYEYDSKDKWEHHIQLIKITQPKNDKDTRYPIILSGANTCPLEGNGGIEEYKEMVRLLQDPDSDWEAHNDWYYGFLEKHGYDCWEPHWFDKGRHQDAVDGLCDPAIVRWVEALKRKRDEDSYESDYS